jgi:hypothetical protein
MDCGATHFGPRSIEVNYLKRRIIEQIRTNTHSTGGIIKEGW